MSEIEETAKATQEVAKVAGKGIDAASGLGGFLKKILGPGFEQLGGAFGDWASVYRYQNASKLAAKVEALHAKRGLQGKTIPIAPRLAIPLLQQATLEDDDMLLEMWASLMANATDPNRHVEARRSFITLLSSLEPTDARVLWLLYSNSDPDLSVFPSANSDPNFRINADWVAEAEKIDKSVAIFAIEALGRLGLVIDHMPDDADSDNEVTPVPLTHPMAHLVLTFTARALLDACSPKKAA